MWQRPILERAQYDKAIALFDQFADSYSFHKKSSSAKLRIALAYDLLDRPPKQVQELYRDVINTAAGDVVFEARIRYVGFTSIRKMRPTIKEREERVLLDSISLRADKDREQKQLLWLARLRTLIIDKKFKEALSYLEAIPIEVLPPSYKRVFKSDGAEIIYGLLDELYRNSDYSRVVKIWETIQREILCK